MAKKKFKAEDIKIVWFGEQPDDVANAENLIRSELYELMCDGDMKLSDLLFHTTFLTNSMDNDIVTLAPLKQKNTVEAIYQRNPVWQTAEMEDGTVAMIEHDDRDTSTKH